MEELKVMDVMECEDVCEEAVSEESGRGLVSLAIGAGIGALGCIGVTKAVKFAKSKIKSRKEKKLQNEAEFEDPCEDDVYEEVVSKNETVKE